MKIKLQTPLEFIPVVITLESQKEVDELFAIVNFTPIHDSSIHTASLLQLSLNGYESEEYRVTHDKLCTIFPTIT